MGIGLCMSLSVCGVLGGGLVKYGVLGLLIEQRGYGYDLVQRLARRLGVTWQLNSSAVYTALDQLEDEKLIEAVPAKAERMRPAARPSRRSERVVYQATERGVAEFRAWLARPSERVDPIRSELQLKVALAGADNVSPPLASIAHEEWLIARHLHEACLSVKERRGGDQADAGWSPATRMGWARGRAPGPRSSTQPSRRASRASWRGCKRCVRHCNG